MAGKNMSDELHWEKQFVFRASDRYQMHWRDGKDPDHTPDEIFLVDVIARVDSFMQGYIMNIAADLGDVTLELRSLIHVDTGVGLGHTDKEFEEKREQGLTEDYDDYRVVYDEATIFRLVYTELYDQLSGVGIYGVDQPKRF